MQENNKLSPEQYWQWRFRIDEMWLADSKMKEARLKIDLRRKDMIILKLQDALDVKSLTDLDNNCKDAKTQYDKLKEDIEKALNLSLNNCTIDDVTYEVKKLQDEVKAEE